MTLASMIALAAFGIALLWLLRWAVRAALWRPPPRRSRARGHGPAPAWSYAGSGRTGSRLDRRRPAGDPDEPGDPGDPEDVARLVTSWTDSHRSGPADADACATSDTDRGDVSCSDTGSTSDSS